MEVWRERLNRLANSTSSVRAFARTEGVSEQSIYHWRKRLGRKSEGAGMFVEVSADGERAHVPGAEYAEVVVGRMTLRVPLSANEEVWHRILVALGRLR